MKYNPHDYQKYAIDFIISHPIAAVLLDMGLGKSVITLTALLDLLFDSFLIRKVLVIAPLRVARDTWPAEIKKWDHLKELTFSVAVGSEEERKIALLKKADIYIINRENVDWLVNKSGVSPDNDDISSSVIFSISNFDTPNVLLSSFKSYQAKRFKSLMKIRPFAKRVIGLTGTPSSNGLMDLWAEFKVLDMGERLGRFITRYRESFFRPDKRNGQIVFSYSPIEGAEKVIYEKISDITISMKTSDNLVLPECVMNEVKVQMDSEEMRSYKKMKAEMTARIKDQIIDAMNAASLSGKLLQMANGAVYDEEKIPIHIHDKKLEALEDLIEGVNGKPVLIAYWFKHDAERIKKRFSVREIKKSADIDDWNKGLIPIAIIHPASAGHGLNLQQGGSTLIWFGLTWSLELYQQTNARLHRQGQKDSVVIHHIICKDTIDEDVMRALKRKDATQSALIDAVKAAINRQIDTKEEMVR